jgi:flagellar biosynthesis protein FliR
VLALLLLIDLALAMLERVNSHLHLLALAFPVKMLAALLVLASTVAVFPTILESTAERTFRVLAEILALRK